MSEAFMIEAMNDVLVFGVGVALSPIPIVAMLLVLGGPAPRLLGTCFALGWLAGVTLVVGGLVAVVTATGATDDELAWIALTQIVLGVVFLVAAVVVQLRKGANWSDAEPRWLGAVDRLTVERTTGLGLLVSVLNPKNLALMLGAAIALARADLGRSEAAQTIVLFVLVACVGVTLPLLLFAVAPGRSHAVLVGLRTWIARHDSTVLALLALAIGAKFLYDGVGSL